MSTNTDYLVIGAGPGGLQLGYFLQQAGRDYLILEAEPIAGAFFRTFPRHRQLISINKPHTGSADPEFNLRMDWNSLLSSDSDLLFTRYTGRYFPHADDMVRYLGDFAATTGLRVRYGTRVTEIRKDANGTFQVAAADGTEYQAPRLIVATGPAKPYLPAIPGLETAEQYGEISVNPRDFTDQRVLIIGKGNSGFETADNLISTAAVIHVAGPSSIRMSWQSHYVGHLRAVNNNFLDTYQLKSQNALLDGNILRIERDPDGYRVAVSFSRANEVTKDIHYDRVIVCTGFRFDHSMFAADCRPELVINDRFPAQTSSWESVNIPHLYFSGTLMQVRDFKRSTSGFIHGFRYCTRALHRILEQRYHDTSWPHQVLSADPAMLANTLLDRANRTSALWQQFGQLCDLVLLDHAGGPAFYQELPVDYVPESDFGTSTSYLTMTLEYGPDHDKIDPFDISIRRVAQNAAEVAHDAAYLHPVIRHYRDGRLQAEHHVAENLENNWTDQTAHQGPLRAFLARGLAKELSAAVG